MMPADLDPGIARMVTATRIPPGTAIDLTPIASDVPTLRPCACGGLIPLTGKRGRPRVRCDLCETAKDRARRGWSARNYAAKAERAA